MTIYYAAAEPANPIAPYATPATAGNLETVFLYARTAAVDAIIYLLPSLPFYLPEVYSTQSILLWNIARHIEIAGYEGVATIDGADTHHLFQSGSTVLSVAWRRVKAQALYSLTIAPFSYFNGGAEITLEDCEINNCQNNSTTLAVSGMVSVSSNVSASVNIIRTKFNNNINTNVAEDKDGGCIRHASSADMIISNSDFIGNISSRNGGCLFTPTGFTADISLIGCSLLGNHASLGGAVKIDSGVLTITDSILSDNTAVTSGGAVHVGSVGEHIVTSSTLERNTCQQQGGAIIFFGSGVVGHLDQCRLNENSVTLGYSAGGALKYSFGAHGSCQRSEFWRNASGMDGGAIDFGGSDEAEKSSVLNRCLFVENTAARSGGAVSCIETHTVTGGNNTYTNNTALVSGNSLKTYATVTYVNGTSFANDIYWGNGVSEIDGSPNGDITIDHSIVQGGVGAIADVQNVTNILSADPLFVSTTDYNLQANSPAINTGTIIAGIHDQATPATDINGTSVLTIPDIGAYEYPGGLYFNVASADGGNGTRALPYNAWTDYPWTGYNLRAGAEIYLQGAMAGTLDLSGLADTGAKTVKGWPGKSATIKGFVGGTNDVLDLSGGTSGNILKSVFE